MKTIPFDYSKYKNEGYEVVCRDGSKPTELHLFETVSDQYPVRAVVDGELKACTKKGAYYKDGDECRYDLFLVAKPVERWMNVRREGYTSLMYKTEKDARDHSGARIALLRLTFSDETLSELLTSTPVAL